MNTEKNTNVTQIAKENPEIKELFKSPGFSNSLTKRTSAKREEIIHFIKFFESAIYKNPKLLECSTQSIITAAQNLIDYELSPLEPLGQAYLIPKYNKKIGALECKVHIGWRGLCAMAAKRGGLKSPTTGVIYIGDGFRCVRGLQSILEHEIVLEGNARTDDEIIGVYAIVTLKNGEKIFEVMGRGEIEDIKNLSESVKNNDGNSPWFKFFGEMARKTVLRRLLKYVNDCPGVAYALEKDTEYDTKDYVDISEVQKPSESKMLTSKIRAQKSIENLSGEK